jgi:hypothetical protein
VDSERHHAEFADTAVSNHMKISGSGGKKRKKGQATVNNVTPRFYHAISMALF